MLCLLLVVRREGNEHHLLGAKAGENRLFPGAPSYPSLPTQNRPKPMKLFPLLEDGQQRAQHNARVLSPVECYVERTPFSLALNQLGVDHLGRGGGCSLDITFHGGKDGCVVLCLLLVFLKERNELHRLGATALNRDCFPDGSYSSLPTPNIALCYT